MENNDQAHGNGQTNPIPEPSGGVGGANVKTLLDDRWKRRGHARTIVRMLSLGVFSEDEITKLLRAAGPLAAHAALNKKPREYRAVMSIIIAAAQLEQTEMAAVERNGRPVTTLLINNQGGQTQINLLSPGQIEKISDDELFRLHQEAIGLPVEDPPERPADGDSRNGSLSP
jgi:hypothetical protein